MQLLMLEGNLEASRKRAHQKSLKTTSEIYCDVINALSPDTRIDVLYAADGERLTSAEACTPYSGLVITGSSLHAPDSTPEVLNQIDCVNTFSTTGKPILGSCWGLQITAMAAGGRVAASRNGREIGPARKIFKTAEGLAHPLLAGKPAVYDAPCIHSDEVIQLPPGARLLAGNRHSQVQAAAFTLGKSEVWGVQYHPEFSLSHLAGLYGMYQEVLIREGFFNTESELKALQSHYAAILETPANPASMWQTGLDSDMLDFSVRTAEIRNWLATC